MTRRMRTSKTGLELIKSFEGFRARAKSLPDGRWTIGYGHTQSARENLRITRADAEAVLREYDLPPIELVVSEAILAPLNQNEFDALVSFVFNIGESAFLRSKMLAFLNAGQPLAAVNAMSNWRKANVNGRVMVVDALVRRRVMEQALFLKHPSGQPIAPSTLFHPVRVASPIKTALAKSVTPPVTPKAFKSIKPHRPIPEKMEGTKTNGRLTRELGRPTDESSLTEQPERQLGPTPDEITRAISALANPESVSDPEPIFEVADVGTVSSSTPKTAPPPFDIEDDLPHLPGIDYGEDIDVEALASVPEKPVQENFIDDLEPVEVDPLLLQQAVAEAEAKPPWYRQGILYTALGFAGLLLSAFGVFNLRNEDGVRAARQQATDLGIYLNFAAIVFGAFFILLALYLTFRSRKNILQ